MKEAGLEEFRPTDEALQEMGMKRKRFTQLLENANKTPIQVQELEGIKNWIRGLADIDTDNLIGQANSNSFLGEKLGMVK